MPEVYFEIEWPDGEVTTHYSPSTVVRLHFQAGQTMTVEELRDESSRALTSAGERVKDKYGFDCTGASESLAKLLAQARTFEAGGRVKIKKIA